MKRNTIVTPSSQVDTVLPLYISETYRQFVKFMTMADQSEERLGFSQDLLQNLQKYRDFNTYKNRIVQNGVLSGNLSETDETITLEDGYGFPEDNGVIQIDDEVILYRKKEGNVLLECYRGASGTVILPTFRYEGEFLDSVPATHTKGSVVRNISVLFLVQFLKTIYQSYVPDINPQRVAPEINNATLLENIKDFFQSKGSKLGIKALFKILFAENDVDVRYPGERMIIPSKSTFAEAQILRVTPQPRSLVNPEYNYVLPTDVMNGTIKLKSYNDDKVYAESICEYVSSYPYEDVTQYEINLDQDKNVGNFIANPLTRITTEIEGGTTITVESTLGFPEKGIIFIQTEAISYESKTFNQFINCKRGVKGYEQFHPIDTKVYGPYYIQSEVTIDNVLRTSISYPLGLVKDINIIDGGALHTKQDDVYINGPGRVDPREPALASFYENYDDQFVSQAVFPPALPDVENYTAGINGVFFDSDYVFVASSGFPYYTIGGFSDNGTVGSNLVPNPSLWAIPRLKRNNSDILTKGTDEIGISVDGVPIYSETSPENLIRGIIQDFSIIDGGDNYINPTVIISPPLSGAKVEITNGHITNIIQTSVANYFQQPNVRITSGEGATFEPHFDAYGRITRVDVLSGGAYYNDLPQLRVTDASARGTGAVLSCTIIAGEITAVRVENAGIDYRPQTTSVSAIPTGSGARVTANVETYDFNRYQSVVNNDHWTFDSGNGFVWGDNAEPPVVLDTYGYVCNPTQLRGMLGDDGTEHSPILGWAFDGNPIYGPYGWANNKNASGGITRQVSGYVLRNDRSGLGGSPPSVGSFDPENNTYPMGTFVQDYRFIGSAVNDGTTDFDLTTDAGDTLITTDDEIIEATLVFDATLNENNGKVCNTPEYPEESYPDGIFAYFVTVNKSDTIPEFPYYIGKTFNNRPLSQIKKIDTTDISPDTLRSEQYSPSSYDDTEVTFNLDYVERYRNPYLNETKDEVALEISGVTTGGITGIYVESGLPQTTKVGDLLKYEIPDSGSGSGAEGIVTYLTGESITKAQGSIIDTKLRSHRQIIDLSAYKDLDPVVSFVFVRGTRIYETSGAIGVVSFWDTANYRLEIQVTSYYLFKYSQPSPAEPYYIYDNRNTPILIQEKPTSLFTMPPGSARQATRPNRVTVINTTPTIGIGGLEPEPGDIAWAVSNGRMYVYFDDGDSTQWVESQPVGMTPLGNEASDVGVGTLVTTADEVLNSGADNTVTISANAPDGREDGSSNVMGDLWWSQQTGILYIWYTDIGTAQWVMTEPSATVPNQYADNQLYPELPPQSLDRGNVFERSITVTISPDAPSVHSDGSPITVGDLWWSSANGKMYIYYEDSPNAPTNNIYWVQCNPVGSLTSQYSEDDPVNPFPPGPTPPLPPGPTPPDPLDPYPGGDFPVLPEKPEQKLLWFQSMKNFFSGDNVDFIRGLPGQEELTENSLLESEGPPDDANGIFNRGVDDIAFLLPDGTTMLNQTRTLFTITTSAPHNLRVGDLVFIENSDFAEVNGVHEVKNAGIVIPGDIQVGIEDVTGSIDSLTIIDGGKYYTRDFLITFDGGGFAGGEIAYGYAYVDPIELGGSINRVEILKPGKGYTSPPNAVLGNELNENEYVIWLNTFYGLDGANIKYSTNGEGVESTVAYIDVVSSGAGYEVIPAAQGLKKRDIDRAEFIVNGGNPDYVTGRPIEEVEVVFGGARYVNPTIIFGDIFGTGSGATAEATIENGSITGITVTDGGSGYIDPVCNVVEQDGKFVSLSKTIGRITSGNVINPGRDISVDRSLRPELMITTRCVITYTNQARGPFAEGSEVYQGTSDNKLVTAIVVSYDDAIQQLTLEKVEGVLRAGEEIKDDYGTTANVLQQGEADCRALVSGTSTPRGIFITPQSQVSTTYSVIQDSKKYQWFSYEINSSLMRDSYENLVVDIIHPSGFVMYSAVEMNSNIQTTYESQEPVFLPRLLE